MHFYCFFITHKQKQHECTVCGQVRQEEIPDPGHDWGEWELTTPATCSAKGVETRLCNNNPEHKETRETEVDPEAHVWGDEPVVDVEPTYQTEGVKSIHCTLCGAKKPVTEVVIPVKEQHDVGFAEISKIEDMTYTGLEIRPEFSVVLNGKVLTENTDYTVYHVKNINVGISTLIIIGKGQFNGVKLTTFKITPANNTLFVKAKTNKVKYKKLKKKNQTITATKAFTVKKAQGRVTYKKAGGEKKITISSTGKITVKKGLKKGTYKLKVNVTAAGNNNYLAKTAGVTVTVKVK